MPDPTEDQAQETQTPATEETAQGQGQEPSTSEQTTATQEKDNQPLGEPGLKALHDERTARKEAEKAARSAAEGLAKTKQQLDEALANLAAEQAARTNAELALVKRDAALAAGLPHEMANRLQGSTKEEIEADAKALAETLGAKPGHPHNILPPNPNQGKDTGTSSAASGVEEGRDLYRRFMKKGNK